MPEVSIILPVYNSEESLHKCINSILNQTFADFELIIINDGSNDNSLKVCEELKQQDNRITLINQKNSGVSAARNKGLSVAKGSYIMFCDSDDYVDDDWIESLYNTITENTDSLIVCNMNKSVGQNINYDFKSENNHMSYFELYKIGMSAYTPNKIFSRRIIAENNLTFDINCSFSEDVKFICEYYNHCKDVVFINKQLYYYNISDTGLSKSYKANSFDLHIMPFSIRISHIAKDNLNEYCNIWLYLFINLFDNIFDKRNTRMSLSEKFKYNNKMIRTPEFQFCVEKSTENKLFKSVLKLKNYYVFWIFQKLTSIKQKLRSEN